MCSNWTKAGLHGDLQQGYLVSDHMIAATHLSCYCAYLEVFCPELLPADDEQGRQEGH
jgi:hypothetical protein